MHFSSMVVSVLAQSVPLLAVSHLAGWKTREERSWLQRRRLRDALLVGFHDKKGMLSDKRVGVHDKQNDVLEKKLSGSARLLQDSALSDVPSDDREASVECDPLSKVNDSGIFGCGMDSHCVESEESEMGGFCVASKQASSISRDLQVTICNTGPDAYGLTCDCSQHNSTSGVGSFNCTAEVCFSDPCVTATFTATFNADGSYITESCLDTSEVADSLFDSYGSIYSSDLASYKCGIKIGDVLCNSCEFEDETCPPAIDEICCQIVNCTNIIADYEGNTCDLVSTDAPNASPSETLPPATNDKPTVPLTTDAPNASPFETVLPATSSGSTHAAKVTIVVSAAAAAWMASFGT